MAKLSPTERVAGRMSSEMSDQSARLVTRLQSEFNGPDRAGTSTSTWHTIIRQNWDNPEWRQAQSDRMGPVSFANDALSAFGVDPKLLKTLPPTGEPMPTTAAINPTLPLPPEAMQQ